MSETLTAKIPRMHSPVNRLAASVIRPGIRYEETFTSKSEVLSDAPLPTRAYPQSAKQEDNLTGQKFGRFTVIGMAASSPIWVVRCACGRFCYRKAKALKTPELQGRCSVMCPRCVLVEKKKSGEVASDSHKKNLHAASFPLYLALQEILRIGLNKTTREMARDAMGLAEGRSEEGKDYLAEVIRRKEERMTSEPN